MTPVLQFWIAAGVTVGALALLMQALSTYALLKGFRRLQHEVEPLIPQARETLETAQKTLRSAAERIEDLHGRATATLDMTQRQLAAFDETRVEMTARFRVQAERMELIMDDSLSRVHEVVSVLHNGVMKPVREVNGIMAGLRTGLQTFMRGRRPSVAEATHDEELFI